jgi:acyl transferase domain-containing protein/NAD(P)H-dependent flavin oxidoreductase YrpB (nitropropane dioxygenase family)
MHRLLEIVAGNPEGCPEPDVAIAASRWGATGLLNLEGVPIARAQAALARLLEFGRGTLAVKLDAAGAAALAAALPDRLALVVLTTSAYAEWPALARALAGHGRRIFCECTSEEQARFAVTLNIDGLVAKGGEAGGYVGEETTFVLVQRLLGLGLPVFAAGGISPHTAAACQVAGCAGVVIDAALALTRESKLPAALRAAVERTEGDDTVCVGAEIGERFRLHRKPGARLVEELEARERELAGLPREAARAAWRAEIGGRRDTADPAPLLPLGQDASFAAPLARRYRTVPAVLDVFRAAIAGHVADARETRPLAPDAPLARAHGTTYPILQGPMTRVSDTPAFADAVSAGGALPFLALALMRGPEVAVLLEQTQARLGDRPWGVGILGFVPPELRQEQLAAVLAAKPPFALIAGGRPDQALSLEAEGIATYLHVPSPRLLGAFLDGGARRFVFEGRECGGHVGPRTSFVLWTAMIDTLLDALSPIAQSPRDGGPMRSGVVAEEVHVVFAGGIHDARSAAMVAALAAPLAAAGVRIGVLMGTAYLFTEEAVAGQAITPVFQGEALACGRTVLFEISPGHAIRCVDTPYFQTFLDLKRRLVDEGHGPDELKDALETVNLGRLRLASKAILREDGPDGATRYVQVEPEEQRLGGMYMVGQVAALRDGVVRVADLHRDVSAGATALLESMAIEETRPVSDVPPPYDVAIVGLGCVLPGAPDVRAFWSNVLDRVDAITEVPPDRFNVDPFFDPDVKARDRIVSKWGGFLSDVPFDPVKYGIPPSALPSIDALQLLSLEVVDQALTDAGMKDRTMPKERASVIFGASGGLGDLGLQYGVRAMLPTVIDDVPESAFAQLPEWTEDSFAGILLNVAAGRVANRFDFGGVNYTVDAACASSLAAMQLGAAELQRGTSDLVVVGGVDTVQTPFGYMCFSKSQALSPRGKCRTFDESADGIAISEGVVAFVLKRVADAERDGDRIYAVIKAVAGSSDGRGKGLTAPRPEGQLRALRRAYAQARISPASVGLIEAHGTGTVAGDAAEVAALDELFRAEGAPPESCAIGSVKSMIGHTKAAAGVAGMLKATLALHHGVRPPTLNVEKPNARLRTEGSPFFINTEAAPWLSNGTPRRAGVSSFGFGGTNFHAVLEEYTGAFLGDTDAASDRWPAELFVWGASDAAELASALAMLSRAIEGTAAPALASLASAVCRAAASAAAVRLSIVATSIDDLRAKIAVAQQQLVAGGGKFVDPRGIYLARGGERGKVVFLFPGQGSQAPGMLRDLAVHFSEVRDAVAAFDGVLDRRFPRALSSYIYPPPSFTPGEDEARRRALTDTHVAQPAIGAVSVGMLKLLEACGVEADMVAGHSYGEYVALHAAGAIDQPTLAELSERRGYAIANAVGSNPGSMAAATGDAEHVRKMLAGRDDVWLANFNAPQQTIIAGVTAAVEQACADLDRAGILTRKLPVACAFHTPLMRGARVELDRALAAARFHVPRVPIYSNSLAAPYPAEAAGIARVLSDHLMAPVRFADQISAMYAAGGRVFVEVGPGAVLSTLTRKIAPDAVTIALDRTDTRGLVQFLQGLGQLSVHGVPVDTARLFRGRTLEPLDAAFGPLERRRAAAWVVNGAGARPVAALKQAAVPRVAPAVPQPATSPEPAVTFDSPVMNQRTPSSIPLSTTTDTLAAAAGTDAVMLQFQQVMSHFLNTQGAVMAAYLGAAPSTLPAGVAADLTVPLSLAPASAAPSPADAASIATTVPLPAPVPAPIAASASVPQAAANGVAVPAPVARAAADSTQDFSTLLVNVAAERTGYTPDMLDLDAGVEADLGIDSIKRVEILATLRKQCSEADQAKLSTIMDTLTRARTLREMSAAMTAAVGAPERAAPPAPAAASIATPPPQPRQAPARTQREDTAALPRVVFQIVDAPPVKPAASSRAGAGITLVTDDGDGIASDVCARLNATGERTMLLRQRPGAVELSREECFADWTNAADAARALERIRGTGRVAALIHLAPLAAAPAFDRMSLTEWQERLRLDLRQLHVLVQAAAPDLLAIGRARGATILAATACGGDFGDSGRIDRPTHGGILGYLRTAAIELSDVRVRVVDLEADDATRRSLAAVRVLAELDSDGPLEIGYIGARRITLAPRPAALPRAGVPPIAHDSVVLLTGGARGITAQIAIDLARRFRPTLVLVGRAPLIIDAGDAAEAQLDGAALKAAITQRLRAAQGAVKPVDIERAYQRIVHQREISQTVSLCESAGARVEYRQADVRDEAAFAAVLEGIYQQHRRLDVVIHGAGIIEDKLIADKTTESFDRVVHTKGESVFTLLRHLQFDSLRALMLMSSVTAAFGNRGQADYGAANGIYNAVAQWLARRTPARTVALNWGPWDQSGMASAEVRRQFLARGITPIDPAAGVRAVLDELASGDQSDAVVVLGGGPWVEAAASEDALEMQA